MGEWVAVKTSINKLQIPVGCETVHCENAAPSEIGDVAEEMKLLCQSEPRSDLCGIYLIQFGWGGCAFSSGHLY